MANLPSLFRPGSIWARNESPFRELSRIQNQIDRIFDEFTSSWPDDSRLMPESISTSAFPACSIEETESHYVLSFDVPGVKKDDIKIELLDNELCVYGERKEEREEKGKSRYEMERYHGEFSRSFTLPKGIKPEQVETEFMDGVLRIAVPRLEAEKVHQIKIGEGKPGFIQKLLGSKKEEHKKVA
ncbi:Hsp20/alpha crystallin family protein [Bdellovibrionota bacterium FG-2]